MASRKSKKIWIWIGSVVLLFIVVIGVGAARLVRTANIDPNRIAKVQRGDVARSVVATGKIQPLSKVEVKSKASGIVERLFVDYGERVKTGQVLAEREARANLRSAEAAFERTRVEAQGPDLPFLKSSLERARKLYAEGLIAPSLLEDADKAYQMGLNKQTAAKSQAAMAKAEVEKAKAALERY